MKKQSFYVWYARFLGLYTAVCGALLAFACYSLYRSGTQAENLLGEGLYKNPVFSRENVAQKLSSLAPVLMVYLLSVIVGLLLRTLQDPQRPRMQGKMQPPLNRHAQRSRLIVLLCALVLLALGIGNGGIRDVLYKAINICTECIGLG